MIKLLVGEGTLNLGNGTGPDSIPEFRMLVDGMKPQDKADLQQYVMTIIEKACQGAKNVALPPDQCNRYKLLRLMRRYGFDNEGAERFIDKLPPESLSS